MGINCVLLLLSSLIGGQLGGESGFWEVISSTKFSQQDPIFIDNICEGHHQIANWQNPEKLQTWQTRRQSRPTFEQFRKQFSFPHSLPQHYCVGRLGVVFYKVLLTVSKIWYSILFLFVVLIFLCLHPPLLVVTWKIHLDFSIDFRAL